MCSHECCPPVKADPGPRPHPNPTTVEERLADHDWMTQNQFNEHQALLKMVYRLSARLYAAVPAAAELP